MEDNLTIGVGLSSFGTMTTRRQRLRHSRRTYIEDKYYGYLVSAPAGCGEQVHAFDSLPLADFRRLSELQNAGQLDPAELRLCPSCIAAMDTV